VSLARGSLKRHFSLSLVSFLVLLHRRIPQTPRTPRLVISWKSGGARSCCCGVRSRACWAGRPPSPCNAASSRPISIELPSDGLASLRRFRQFGVESRIGGFRCPAASSSRSSLWDLPPQSASWGLLLRSACSGGHKQLIGRRGCSARAGPAGRVAQSERLLSNGRRRQPLRRLLDRRHPTSNSPLGCRSRRREA
jgi:hypothetical protein